MTTTGQHEKRIEYQEERATGGDNRRLSDLVDLWYKFHGQTLKDGKKRYGILHVMCKSLDNPFAASFTTETFARYREKRSHEVSTATVNREHAYLRAVFNELLRLEIIKYKNPLEHMRQFKEKQSLLRFLTGDEIEILLSHCKLSSNRSLLLVVELCLATGARWSEVENLRASHVSNNQVNFIDTKSNRKNRAVPISDQQFNQIKKLEKTGDTRLFRACFEAFRAVIKKSGLELPDGQLTHVLRHSFASHFIMNGRSINVLKEILGHSTIVTTMRYAHLAPEFLNEALLFNPLVKPAV